MSKYRNRSWCFLLGIIILMLSGVMLVGFTQTAGAAERVVNHRVFVDTRHHLNHSFPVRGAYIKAPPAGHRVVVHRGLRYYFHGGAWYLPRGGRFVVVAPPFGLIVPFLPPFYTTIRIGGMPYYYANEVYYVQRGDGYAIVEPPQGDVSEAPEPMEPSPTGPTSTGDLFIYPRQGQSEQKKADDRYECHKWAVNQTGYDPTNPSAASDGSGSQKNTDYRRAITACLDGRGYTVR